MQFLDFCHFYRQIRFSFTHSCRLPIPPKAFGGGTETGGSMKRDLLAVVLIAVVGLFVLGAAAPDGGEVGRYQVVVGEFDRKSTVVMVDTATGWTYWRGEWPMEYRMVPGVWNAVAPPDQRK